jgi:hypothetical protein
LIRTNSQQIAEVRQKEKTEIDDSRALDGPILQRTQEQLDQSRQKLKSVVTAELLIIVPSSEPPSSRDEVILTDRSRGRDG